VPRIDAPQAGGSIEDFPSVVASVIHSLGGNQQSRRRLKLSVGGEWHPECGQIGLFNCLPMMNPIAVERFIVWLGNNRGEKSHRTITLIAATFGTQSYAGLC
jgi:hypothetical protein